MTGELRENFILSAVGYDLGNDTEKKFVFKKLVTQQNGILLYILIGGWLTLLSRAFIRCGFLEIIIFKFNSTTCIGYLI